MRGRTPVVDDTPKRAPPVPNREAARAADITAVRAVAAAAAAAASCTEGNILPCFSSPTAVTSTKMVTSTTSNSTDDQQQQQSQKNNSILSPLNCQKDHHKESYNNTTTYYRGNQSTTQDKRSRLTNVINSLYRKVPVNDRSSVERNLETLEKYVMTVLNGVIKDAESSDESGNKNDDVCYSGPNKESRIIDDVKSSGSSNTSTINCVSSEPSGIEPAVPSVTIAQENDSCDNKHKEEVIEEVKKEVSTVLDDVVDEALITSHDVLKSIGVIDNNDSLKINTSSNNDRSTNIESSMCEDASDTIETICRELLNDLVNEICQTIDEPSSLQCSLPLDKIAPALENCYDEPVVVSNSSKSMVRHLCLYCDRKFLSISLRQRHTERVHQLGGGRRSDRNIRKTNCQYCSEKSADNLDGLFQHMIVLHSDKYHGCLQCSTRYTSKDELQVHNNESHPEKTTTIDESFEEVQRSQIRMFKSMKLNLLPRVKNDVKESFQDFDSSFYSNVSYNIRENLLHHLDGKLHHNNTQCYQQTYHESTQCPIDISLTAATPVYNKDPSNDESENSSEYAQKPGKIGSLHHPRRVSFEKYNFPKKYDGKEWTTCAIGDLSKFDISTQLMLRRKQQVIKEKLSTYSMKCEDDVVNDVIVDAEKKHASDCEKKCEEMTSSGTQFSVEFGNFIRLRKWSECCSKETAKNEEVVYAELTGEWSRPRVYICGACSSKHETLKDVEEHKVISHPNVWCSHLEFSGDQTELDKHLVLPGRGVATVKAKNAILVDKVCTKCSKMCNTLAELHKHMLECGGDQAWLLGLFGNNGKKKCKWRPFGSRRRRQRGMKRNIQNSQNSQNQVNKTPKEKQPSGPRVRPSDRETIEKMLANLPAKRSTRRTMQEINLRSQGRMCKIQTRSRQHGTDTSNSRLSHKAVLRNKLIKNAKSFQRKRCRGDNINAAIESVISNYNVGSKIRRNQANDGTLLAGAKDTAARRRRIKIQDVKSLKTLKNRKTALKLVDAKSRATNGGTPTRRRRAMDLGTSFASLKAKSQLRTTDGKFARNPIKTDQSAEQQSTSSSSSQTSGQMTRNTGRKSKDKLSIPGLPKRVTRVSSDADKMPTLEPADKLTTVRAVDSSKATNELPILSPVVAKSPSKIMTKDDKDQPVVIKKRGRRSLKNMDKPPIISDDADGNSGKIVHTRTRKSQESQSAKSTENSADKAQCDSSNKKVNAQLTSSGNKKGKSESPVKVTEFKRTRLSRRTSLESLKSTIDEDKTSVNVKNKIKRNAKQVNQKIIKTPSPKVGKGKRKLQDEIIDNKDVTTTRKSPRNTDKKSTVSTVVEAVSKKTKEKNDVVLTRDSDNKSDENKIEVEKVNKAIDNPQLDLSTMSDDAKNESIETKPLEEIGESEKVESKNNLDTANEEITTEEASPIEIVSDLVNLSFEHLQQESSNSNIDSGKENSSETPINITKSKIPKPKKARGQRRDRKRTLNNVIGILTEGVNIPIEAQQSVVLTVQTSIENINLPSHNSNIQNDPNRLEPTENNATASNSVNNPSDSSLVPEAVNKDNNDTDSQKIETGEKSSQVASTPEVQSSPSVEPRGSEAKTSVSSSNMSDQFSNDIILDLSRRKQKGKGSFLEKIVSKIAKQKDALLDNDVGSLLDHAVDELSIILDDAGPKSVDNEHQNAKPADSDLKTNSVKKEAEKPKVEDKPAEPQEQKPKVEESPLKIEEAEPKVEEKIEVVEGKPIVEETSEDNKQVKNLPTECNESLECQTSEVSEAIDCRKSEETTETSSSLQSINQEEAKEMERSSKKRSSDTSPPTKSKKKSADTDNKKDEETKVDDELYLTDIMKLINNTNKNAPSNSPEELPKGKRKINDEKPNEVSTENSSKEETTSNNNNNKKSRRSQKVAKNENKSINVSNRGRRSSKRNMSVNNPKAAAESRDCEIDETKADPDNSMENEKNMEIGESKNMLDNKINEVENDNSTGISQELLVVEQEKVVIKSKKRGGKLKKSLADEHLKLSDDEIRSEDNKGDISEGEIIENKPSFGEVTTSVIDNLETIPTDLSTWVNETMVNETSDKIADNMEDKDTNKTTDKTVDSQPDDKQVTHEKSRSTPPPVKEAKSRRKNTPGKIDTTDLTETPIQRRQTLKRKAKENIFLIEELLDFGEDIDSPETTTKTDDKPVESKSIDDTQLIKEIAEVKDTEPATNELEEEKVTEESKPTSEVINELNSNKTEAIGEPAAATAVVVDEDSPKKRAANFAVVHTKSGEILIVEKKKKFTKEAAKFFCNVCSTSFTRKSSLKKHNLSQSHILQVSKCSNELEETTISQVENSLTENEEQVDGKVLADDKADEITQGETTGNTKINSEETTTTTFNDQLEDKLLDEEICKITENMSHDEYVLTDHISPDGSPDKQINDDDLKTKQKVNLADEHLDLESPSLIPEKSKENSITMSLSSAQNIVFSTPQGHSSPLNTKMALDFSNITEKLKANTILHQTEQNLHQTDQRDENAENISQIDDKIVDKTSEKLDEKLNDKILIDNIDEKLISSEVDETMEKIVENEENALLPSKNPSPLLEDEKIPEKMGKKSKTRGRRSKKKSITENHSSSESECSDGENVKSQEKNKIVKSVFGRAFTGEKLDKVMEVLDDWNSKSEGDSQDESGVAEKSDSKLTKNQQKTDRKHKTTKTFNDSEKSFETNHSRCRQSKKRAEERISRAFEEESIPYDLVFDSPKKDDDKSSKMKVSTESLNVSKDPHVPPKDLKIKCSLKKPFDCEDLKHKDDEKDQKEEEEEEEDEIDDEDTSSKRKMVNLDEPSLDTNSMESIHTRVPSCPRERSSTPDLVSVTTRDSENDGEDFEDDDDDRLSVRGRLSPFYASNAPESSINSGTMSTSNHVASTEGFAEHRRNSSNEFSGEKIVIRSPVLSSQESGVVTIAPTDAIEDNALDVPQEVDEKPAGTRQGKVLNFDEELFVECCSRLKATTENELRGAKKIKLDDYRDETQQSSQGHRQGADRWRDVESQNSLGSLLESVNQLLGEEMYNSNRAMSEKRRNDRSRERLSPIRNPQTDFIRPENHSYEDSLDVAFEHNNKLRDKIQQRMRESENMIATSFPQKMTNNSRNYRHYYDQNEKDESERIKMDENNFNNIHYSSKHLPLEPLVNNKINPTMDGFLDEALSNLLHRNGKHDHNGSTPMNVLAELACAQVATSTTPSSELKSLEKLPSKLCTNPKDQPPPSAPAPKKLRNPIRELFERKKEMNDRRKESLNPVKQRSKKSKHKEESSLIRKNHFGVGLAERKKRHNNYDKKTPIDPPISSTKRMIKDVYEFDDDDSQSDSKFLTSKVSYRAKTADQPANAKETGEINVVELMSRTITKTLDSGKNTAETVGKRLDSMIERKFQESEYHPKTKGALKSFHMEEKQKSGPMDNYVQRKRTRRLTEGSSNKAKRKNKNSKRRSRAWYEDDSSDEFVATAVKTTEDVGVGITKSQRTCSKGKQNLFAELSTSSESEYEVPAEDEQKNAEKAVEINDWMADAEAEIKDDLVESDHPLVIDEKESDDANSDEEPSQRAFELDDLYREDSSVASSDSEDEGKKPLEITKKSMDFAKKEEVKDDEERIPLDEALVLLDTPEIVEKEHKSVVVKESVVLKEEEPVELPEKKVTEKRTENLPLHVFLSRKVQESKKKKEEEKLKKLKEKEKKRELEEEVLVEENREQFVEFQSTRRQRKCAIGKQGLLAEISSSDDEYYEREDKCDYDRKKQKRESKEKRKERYMEKKHELMIAKEQKAIEQQILREVKMKRSSEGEDKHSDHFEDEVPQKVTKKQQKSTAEKSRKNSVGETNKDGDFTGKEKKKSVDGEGKTKSEKKNRENLKKKDEKQTPVKTGSKADVQGEKIEKIGKKSKKSTVKGGNAKPGRKSKNERRNSKERKSTAAKRDDSDDEEIRTTKSWNKVDEGVGVAIGRRKRAAANQLYYWSSSTDDEEEEPPATPAVVEEDDERQEQHGWIVGDSHKKMITMLAMEKQLKEKRRRSEDDYESGKVKNNKKYRNSTS